MKKDEVFQKELNKTIIELFYGHKRFKNAKTLCKDCHACHCCKDSTGFELLTHEAEILKSYITEDVKEKAELAKASFKKDGHYDCPFLKDGKCSVYEVRPFTCSTYFVLGYDHDTVYDTPSDACEDRKGEVYYLNRLEFMPMLPKKILNTLMSKIVNNEPMDMLDIFK